MSLLSNVMMVQMSLATAAANSVYYSLVGMEKSRMGSNVMMVTPSTEMAVTVAARFRYAATVFWMQVKTVMTGTLLTEMVVIQHVD